MKSIFRRACDLSILTALFALVIAASTSPVRASTTDQSNVSNNFYYQGFPALAQTYTAGINGTLVGINLHFYNCSICGEVDSLIQVLAASNGVPTSNVLGSTILKVAPGQMITIDQLITFPQTIPQIAGEQYAIAVNGGFNMTGDPGNLYPRGALFYSFDNGQNWDLLGNDSQYDMSFQTHVAAVPESASVVMLAIGLGMFGFTAWRKRQ